VDKAKQGFDVARLKGGDPFVFGRGGEEAQMLLSHKVPYEVVPGVTSAIAAPAYAGIPVTHRDHTSFVSFITGHEDPTKKDTSMQWDVYAKSNATLVFLMGVKNLENIVKNLIKHGKKSDTPVALVRWGTTARQMTVTGTLETIAERVKKVKLKSPAIIVIGHVVSLRDELSWFDKKPLFGKRIVITRARAQASGLVSRLSKLGAQCIEIPTIQIVPPEETAPLINSIENIKDYDWLIFTSVNGVKFFFDALFDMGHDVRILGHLKFACIGPVTKERLKTYCIISDILPASYRAESVIDAFSTVKIKGKKILLPRAKQARTVLPKELTKMGAIVDDIAAYETRLNTDGKEDLMSLLKNSEIDAITFTSSSTVSNFMSQIESKSVKKLLKNVVIASIGPITSDTARSLDIYPDIEAKEFTIKGLVNSLLEYYDGK
jgi:uroporphyrinogen III methyltransferase/synthase